MGLIRGIYLMYMLISIMYWNFDWTVAMRLQSVYTDYLCRCRGGKSQMRKSLLAHA
jgi:hypothetical protein